MIQEKITNSYGQEIELRYFKEHIPGDMDERVLAMHKKGKEEEEARRESGKDMKPERKLTKEQQLAVMRASMGFPNRDVTDGRIRREEMTVENAGYQIPVIKYTPEGEKRRPCIIFFHGGGFFAGTTKCVENPCKALAMYADAAVFSVDYRLAPEHPYPIGFSDNDAVVKWAHEHSEELGINRDQIGVSGDSAGGNMAAVCAIKDAVENRKYIAFQALIYPTVNLAALPSEEYRWNIAEYDVRSHFPYIYPAVMALGCEPEGVGTMYLGEDYRKKAKDPYVSPLFAEDVSKLAPALIVNAEYDYLRLEGEAYGRKLARAGVPVRMVRYPGMDHAFMDKIGEYPQAEDMMRLIAEEFRKWIE